MSGFIGTAGLTVALVGAAVGGTGAYFTDSAGGTVTGTMGSIKINTAGGEGAENLDLTFASMLPGVANAKTIQYTNAGANNQDVWVVFPQAALGDFNHHTDIGLINDKGTFGEIHIKAGGVAVFDSNNLNDDGSSCPLGSSDPSKGQGPCNPLPKQIRLATNLAPNSVGDMEFSYTAAAKYKGNQGRLEVVLPYQIVATQPGIAPDDPQNATF